MLLFINSCALLVVAFTGHTAIAATFTAETEGRTVKLYASSDRVEQCTASVSIRHTMGGKEVSGTVECSGIVAAGSNSLFCSRSSSTYDGVAIAGNVRASCSR